MNRHHRLSLEGAYGRFKTHGASQNKRIDTCRKATKPLAQEALCHRYTTYLQYTVV